MKEYQINVIAGTKVLADMVETVKDATYDATAEIKAIPPGPLPDLTAGGVEKKMEVGSGIWTWNGIVLKNPSGTDGVPEGYEGTLWFDKVNWTIAKVQELPKVDTSTLTSKAEFTDLETELTDFKTEFLDLETGVTDLKTEFLDLETELTDFKTEFLDLETGVTDLETELTDLENTLYGETSVPILTVVRKDVNFNPDVISPTVTLNRNYGLGGQGVFNAAQLIPAGIYTAYVKVNFSNKGQCDQLAYFKQGRFEGEILMSEITTGVDFEFVFPLNTTTDTNQGEVFARLGTGYPLGSTLPASLTIKDWIIYKGDHTLQEIKAPIDKTKVLKAKQADSATTAQTANTALVAQSLSGNYFVKTSDYVSKVKNKWDAPNVVEWDSYTGSTTNYLTRLNGKLQVGGTVTNYTGTSGAHRLWFGIDVTPDVYLSVSKTFYVVVKGTVTSNNIRNFIIRSASSRLSAIVSEDLAQGIPTPFQRVLEISYPVGSSTTDRYIMTDYTAYDGQTNIGLDVEFEVFSLFEKNSTTDKFTIDDFIKASKDQYELLNKSLLPENVATKEFVASEISNITKSSDEKLTDLETNLYGATSIPILTKVRENVTINPDVISPTVTLNRNYGLGGQGLYTSTSIIPAGSYTGYVKVNFSNKGQADQFAYFVGTTYSGAIDMSAITLNVDYEFVFPINTSVNTTVGSTFSQIRTGYPVGSTVPSVLVIKEWTIYKGNHTLQEIKNSAIPVDKSKVLKAKQADSATLALTANTALVAQSLSGNYFVKLSDYVSKVKNKWDAPRVVEYNNFTGSTTNYLTRLNGKLQVGGTVTNYTGSSSSHRLWFGIDVTPAVYSASAKTFYIVVKGTVTSNNIRNFIIKSSANRLYTVVAEDLTQGIPTSFEKVLEITYPAGSSTNDRYVYADYTAYTGQTSIGLDVEFEVFSLFEKNATTDKFTIDDFIKASKDQYEILNESLLPVTLATKEYVKEEINNSNSSIAKKPGSDEFLDYDAPMIVGYGQSLEAGGGATNSTTYVGNSISFSGGVSLASFTSEVPDTFFNSFIPLKDAPAAYTGTPIVASISTFIQLLRDENTIDLKDYGVEYIPVTAGVSGGSIEVHKKGTNAYNNLIKAITKGKALAAARGKTFGLPILFWTQGEGDRGQTKEWYYTRLQQLFTDLNTDIKAITGQVKDVKFITYQTSPWAGRWYPSGALTQQPGDLVTGPQGIGIQQAQVQIANDMSNVFLASAMYPFLYGDYFHPSDRANVGITRAVNMKRLLVDGIPVKTFQPISHKVISSGSNHFIQLKFDVPVLPARFDLGSDIWHNPNGKQPNFGFKVLSGSTNIISAEPFITKGDTIVIPVSQNPVGSIVTYATDGHWGGGNLCDSQYGTVNIKNIDYKIDNYAVAFDDYLVN